MKPSGGSTDSGLKRRRTFLPPSAHQQQPFHRQHPTPGTPAATSPQPSTPSTTVPAGIPAPTPTQRSPLADLLSQPMDLVAVLLNELIQRLTGVEAASAVQNQTLVNLDGIQQTLSRAVLKMSSQWRDLVSRMQQAVSLHNQELKEQDIRLASLEARLDALEAENHALTKEAKAQQRKESIGEE